jgi:hypothetical protein
MTCLQSQDSCLEAGTSADMQKINALKTLENPAHRWAIGWLVHLVRNGLFRCRKLTAQQTLGQAVHQQTEDHDEAQGNHARLPS